MSLAYQFITQLYILYIAPFMRVCAMKNLY